MTVINVGLAQARPNNISGGRVRQHMEHKQMGAGSPSVQSPPAIGCAAETRNLFVLGLVVVVPLARLPLASFSFLLFASVIVRHDPPSFSHAVVTQRRGGVSESTGGYVYTGDVLCLGRCTQSVGDPLPTPFRTVVTPLQAEAWARARGEHPDRPFVAWVLEGIRQGFRIGFGSVTPHQQRRPAKRNMLSAMQNPGVVREYLNAEREAGRVLGPVPSGVARSCGVHTNRFGVIPKPNQPGKWRLIVDLSHPDGASINDGVDSTLCSLKYASVDDAVRLIGVAGEGALIAKLDIQSAYHNVPVHPDDRILLGMEWEGQTFVDAALPFGLCSAPKIFSALVDALAWIQEKQGSCPLLHYLDDFLLVRGAGSEECAVSLRVTQEVCRQFGVPLAMHKLEGPSMLSNIPRHHHRYRGNGATATSR